MKIRNSPWIALLKLTVGCNAALDHDIFEGLAPLIPERDLWYHGNTYGTPDAYSHHPTTSSSPSAKNRAESSADEGQLVSNPRESHVYNKLYSQHVHDTYESIQSEDSSGRSGPGGYEQLIEHIETAKSPESTSSRPVKLPTRIRKVDEPPEATNKRIKIDQQLPERLELNLRSHRVDLHLTYRLYPSQVTQGELVFDSKLFQSTVIPPGAEIIFPHLQKLFQGMIDPEMKQPVLLYSEKNSQQMKLSAEHWTSIRKKMGFSNEKLVATNPSVLAQYAFRNIRSTYDIWQKAYEDRMQLQISTSLHAKDTRHFQKNLFTYLFLVDMIMTIIPKPAENAGVGKTEAFKNSLIRFAEYDSKAKESRQEGPLGRRGSTMASMWRYLGYWISSEEYYRRLEIVGHEGITRSWQGFFNLLLAVSQETLSVERAKIFGIRYPSRVRKLLD
ncbi:hypothetical protein PGTUg99_021183 [Puccinia graminis f. sp. tritici]|uniref:Uncharacterized protein n=1 Tax=Puccinia graminis f. sp. tritici TaxID=56615 RepID=A0A5B0SK18_PUCGR|nr:hypothetical protein PGTUg99_021183 [Puccinia graminis f. sp. tritici]